MKRKPNILLAAGVATLGLLLVALFAPTAHAITVEVNPGEPCNPASGFSFENESDAYLIDVLFKDNKTLEYGEGTHIFFLRTGALLGGNYFGSLLDAEGDVIPGTAFFGEFPSDGDPGGLPAILNLSQSTVFSGMRFVGATSELGPGLPASLFYSLSWLSSPKPRVLLEGDPVTIGGTVTGLEGSGLVLQNNGADDLPIDSDGPFTFATSLQPCSTYNVTVLTNPTNPTQICSVENGSGDVPTENVTDVAVTCVEPVLADIKKVAAEGETLGDTVLMDILLSGGVAINIDGQVAFAGRDEDGTDAAFTQAGKVAAEGETLTDGTVLSTFREQGELAIGGVQSSERVAFHGQDSNRIVGVFTQAGLVAAEGDTLPPDGTLDEIEAEGKVAINNFAEVAFHGRIEIEGGLFDQKFRAVFTSNGETTQVAAQEVSNLPDGTPLQVIIESGGVAINEFAEVAFHGQTDNVKAVFTQNGVVAKVGTDLLDGNILEYINENGGVAINLFEDVAFHGQTTGGVKAVFTQNGVVAKVGDILPDGTPLDEIEVSGGVAINIFGDVTFHGRTGGVKAVFTQNGVVAKVGDILDNATTLNDIWVDGGVAINPYGPEVAFHGQTGTTDAVFVGLAKLPNLPPIADFSFETANLDANFTDLSQDSDGEVVAWSWSFGDDSTSTEQNPSHTYDTDGTYTVTLTVTDDQGAVSEPVSDSVEVIAAQR